MRGKRKGLFAVRRGKSKTAPQEVLDKYLPKPTDTEIELILNSIYDPVVWEKDPKAYEQALACYKASKGKGTENVPPKSER